jgi:hypothetical protein
MDLWLSIPVWWWVVAAVVVAFLWISAPGKADEAALTEILEATARHYHGALTWEHGRPAIEGLYEGTPIRISFPPRRGKSAENQHMQLRFRVDGASDMRLNGVEPAGELLARGMLSPQAATDAWLHRRLHYVFRALGGSDLTIRHQWAQLTVSWPYTGSGLTGRAIDRPVREAFAVVRLVTRMVPPLPEVEAA